MVAADQVQSYIVGPNDVLAVTVFGREELSGKYAVDSDGTFTFPWIGRVQAGGLTPRAIESRVHDRLVGRFLKEPQVTVSIDQYRSQQILVTGEVRQPGPLQFMGSMTVLEALARVGSTTERAGLEVIIRRTAGAPAADTAAIESERTPTGSSEIEVIAIDLASLQSGAISRDVALRGGDTLFVPRAGTVFVSGYVRSPTDSVLRKPMTVRELLTLAGGVTERGSTGRIQILRMVDGKEVKIDADLQDPVQPGDTVDVRARFF
jgi:polysaccharide export outer membrane protein